MTTIMSSLDSKLGLSGIELNKQGINPCSAELFVSIFHSFEAGIANAISSFKQMKKIVFLKNRHLSDWIISLTEHLSQNMLHIFMVFYLFQNFLENVHIRV